MDHHSHRPICLSVRISLLLCRHLTVYTCWSLFNVIVCLPFVIYSSGSLYYFMLMSFIWGLVNMGFAGGFYCHIRAQRFRLATLKEQYKIQRHICKMLFINIILDTGYILTGIYMIELKTDSNLSMLFMAFGTAIITQGLFLFVMDVWFYSRHYINMQKYVQLVK